MLEYIDAFSSKHSEVPEFFAEELSGSGGDSQPVDLERQRRIPISLNKTSPVLKVMCYPLIQEENHGNSGKAALDR